MTGQLVPCMGSRRQAASMQPCRERTLLCARHQQSSSVGEELYQHSRQPLRLSGPLQQWTAWLTASQLAGTAGPAPPCPHPCSLLHPTRSTLISNTADAYHCPRPVYQILGHLDAVNPVSTLTCSGGPLCGTLGHLDASKPVGRLTCSGANDSL